MGDYIIKVIKFLIKPIALIFSITLQSIKYSIKIKMSKKHH